MLLGQILLYTNIHSLIILYFKRQYTIWNKLRQSVYIKLTADTSHLLKIKEVIVLKNCIFLKYHYGGKEIKQALPPWHAQVQFLTLQK